MTEMETGLLWFDDDPTRTLEDKVRRAATYYHRKHGRQPNLCLVHPAALDGNGQVKKAAGVEIRSGRSILPHHLWIGVEDSGQRAQQLALKLSQRGEHNA